MASHIGRRKFLAMLGGAVAWPLAARAAVGDAGDRIVKQRVSRILRGRIETFQQGIRLR